MHTWGAEYMDHLMCQRGTRSGCADDLEETWQAKNMVSMHVRDENPAARNRLLSTSTT